ncbi:hypothetical protein FPV67DRAFT_1671253 [Lyophyllum atratum]|nr:hypothetical protein FPV67DRAFT_1671253 [Lyophyllum atratum]
MARATRSNTKNIEDIPLPTRRKAPQRQRVKKPPVPEQEKAAPEQELPGSGTEEDTDEEPEEEEHGEEPEDQPVKPEDKTGRKDQHGEEPENESEPEDEEEPPPIKPKVPNRATDASGRPKPVPRRRGLDSDDPDDAFILSRMGFRRSPVPPGPVAPPQARPHRPSALDSLPNSAPPLPPPQPLHNPRPPSPLVSPPHRPITPFESEPSGSDFETTEREKERHLARVPEHRREPTQAELDADDDAAMEDEVRSEHSRRRGSEAGARSDDSTAQQSSGGESSRKKTKRKLKPQPKNKGKERVEAGGDEGREDGVSFKPGPIPDVAKDAAFTAHAEYQRRMAEIAGQYEKPVLSLYQLVGQSVPTPRHEVNRWNAFQAWYGVHGSKKKDKGTKASEWARVLADEYEKHLKDALGEDWEDPECEAKCMESIVEWFKDRTTDYAPNMKADGKFRKVMASVAQKFIQSSAQAYEVYGVHVFGFVVNTELDEYGITNSMAWGGTQAYEQLRNEHQASIASQLSDYQAMFRVADMKLKGLEVTDELFAVSRTKNPGEKDRDHERRIFSMYIRNDLGKILHARGNHTLEVCKQQKVPWVGWADFAYKEKIQIINWPPSARAPAPGFDLHSKDNGIPQHHMKASNTARLDSEDESAIMIVEWSAEQKALADDDPALADVPLVVNTNRRTVLSVSDSAKYQKSIGRKSKSKKRSGLLGTPPTTRDRRFRALPTCRIAPRIQGPPEDVRPQLLSLAVLIYVIINPASNTLTPTHLHVHGEIALTLARGEIVPAPALTLARGEIVPAPARAEIMPPPMHAMGVQTHGVATHVPPLSPLHAEADPAPALPHAGVTSLRTVHDVEEIEMPAPSRSHGQKNAAAGSSRPPPPEEHPESDSQS